MPQAHLAMLDDLLPGGLVTRALDPPMKATYNKRVALVLTRQTYQSFARMGEYRRQLGAFAEHQRDAALRAKLQTLAALAEPRSFARSIATALRRNFASVVLIPDLASFAASGADGVVVVDFAFASDTPGLIRTYEKIIDGTKVDVSDKNWAAANMSYLVLNRRLQLEGSSINDLNILPLKAWGDDGAAAPSLDSNIVLMRNVFPTSSATHADYALAMEFGFERD